MDLHRTKLIHHIAENAGNVVFQNKFFLIDALKQLPTEAVDCLALLVHDVVILEQMLASLKILRLDRFLRGLDTEGNQSRLDGNSLFHAQALQQV